jgi:hypothetical protein
VKNCRGGERGLVGGWAEPVYRRLYDPNPSVDANDNNVMRWGPTLVEDEVLYGHLTTVSGALVSQGRDGNSQK